MLEENQQPNDEDTDMEGGATVAAAELSEPTEEEDEAKIQQDTVDRMVDIDQLNNNTFMPVLTEMIKTLSEVKEKDKKGNETEKSISMPSWMMGLFRAFEHYQSPEHDKTKYIRQVYIAKLITNYPEAFEGYAHKWILPLLKFVVKGYLFGEPINYLVHDICIFLGVWGKTTFNTKADGTTPPSGFRDAVYDCLNYLMQHAHHPNPGVQRDNIDIITKLFNNWGSQEVVPTVSI